MESFTIELISNASAQQFPDKTLIPFTNFLTEQLNLEGQWEVAISEISYPSMYQNVTEGKIMFFDKELSKSSDFYWAGRIKNFSRPYGFMLYGKLGVDFFSTSELLYPNMKTRLRLIRARPKFCMISDNPNVSLGIVDCSFYTRRFALMDDYHKKLMDMLACNTVEFNYLETLAKTFIIPARQNQFIQEIIFNIAPVRRIAIAMNTNSAFTGSYTKNPFRYQQIDLRKIGILKGG